MLNNLWNYASPIKYITLQNKSTNSANNNFSYKNEILKGALYIKLKNSNVQKISNDCLIEINNFKIGYSLRINYSGNELIIDNDTKLFQFINSNGNRCITWQNNSSLYILELFQENTSKEKENIFILRLPTINSIDIDYDSENLSETKSYTKAKCINYSGIKNRNSIKKNIFIKRFEEYKEIYIVRGIIFIYDKLLEEVIPLKDREEDNINSFLKVNYIGNNTYILLLEQNELIIAFIKIENENDISINENSGTISFNYMDEKGENNPYIFSFEEKSLNEMKFFNNLIMRCIYEKNNISCDFNYIPNFLNFDSMDINSEFSQENDINNKSFFFSTKKKYDYKNIFFEENNNDFVMSKNLRSNIQSNININANNNCIMKLNYFNKIIRLNNFGTIEIFDDYSGIKLFNNKGENIKTFISKDRSPIRYIDLSHDYKYILITCDKYLEIINTDIRTKKEPIILSLEENCLIQYNIKNENFTYAKFITNENSEEKMIIANFGQFIIIWNFEKVIKGEFNCFRIINEN